jgi:hypothetical protein
MATLEPLNLEQPDNELSAIAERERSKLIPKNNYKTTDKYSTVHPDALADGDNRGKGTGEFLDVYNQNAGASQDIIERKTSTVINEFQPNKPYTTPTA